MDWNNIEGVETLFWAEPSFIQVLLSRFALHKTSRECILTVEFDENEKTITHRMTKERIRDAIPNFASKEERYKGIFDSILLGRSVGSFAHDDTEFRFRYASGGVLPVLLVDGQEYYCLFFRDVFPVGWNIANGGCDSVTELLDPTITIERELREELIVLALLGNRDYVYRSADGRAIERPEFEIARELWNSFFKRMDFRRLRPFDVEIDWIDGPDRLSTTLLSKEGVPLVTNPTTHCFVNVTAQDFSIELDKIARIQVEPKVLLLDGEIIEYKLLGRPIGLFEVQKTEEKLLAGDTEFYPEIVYYFGNPRPANREVMLDMVGNRYIPRLIKERIRDERHLSRLKQCDNMFSMCPITNRMIRRYAAYKADLELAETVKPTVFISHSSKDANLVRMLRSDLEKAGFTCFVAPDFLKGGDHVLQAIFDAIDGSDKFLLIVSENSSDSRWVQNEVEEAVRLENVQGRDILVPIQTDDSENTSKLAWIKLAKSRQLVDFRRWRDAVSYQEALERLLEALHS